MTDTDLSYEAARAGRQARAIANRSRDADVKALAQIVSKLARAVEDHADRQQKK